MKVTEKIVLLGKSSKQTKLVLDDLQIVLDKYALILNPTPKGNGVLPIRQAFVEILQMHGWRKEHSMSIDGMKRKCLDGHKLFDKTRVGLEWETGNISSSFRAIMKLVMGLHHDEIDIAIHVLPSKAMYRFLTDRVGNIEELRPYFPGFRLLNIGLPNKTFIFVVVEHDETSTEVPLIKKGKDGLSKKNKKNKRVKK